MTWMTFQCEHTGILDPRWPLLRLTRKMNYPLKGTPTLPKLYRLPDQINSIFSGISPHRKEAMRDKSKVCSICPTYFMWTETKVPSYQVLLIYFCSMYYYFELSFICPVFIIFVLFLNVYSFIFTTTNLFQLVCQGNISKENHLINVLITNYFLSGFRLTTVIEQQFEKKSYSYSKLNC